MNHREAMQSRASEGKSEGERSSIPYAHLTRKGDPNPGIRKAIEERGLPAMEAFEKMVDLFIRAHKAGKPAVIEGATGSGKSMLVPLAAEEACRRLGISNRILMSQPRRDATQAVASGVAALKRTTEGGEVGWMTAERKNVSQETRMVVMTDGIFKRWLLEREATKEKVGAIIIDEVHEQNTNLEVSAGKIKQMLEAGTAPVVVLVSATLNKEEIQAHFGLTEEQYLKVEGRTFPIETAYNPKDLPTATERDRSYLRVVREAIARCIQQEQPDTEDRKDVADDEYAWVSPDTEGDILVFLPGAREIRDVEDSVAQIIAMSATRKHASNFEVCTYHGSLEPSVRKETLQKLNTESQKRRIILATNAAETSITFPYVRTVIDTGVRRIKRHDTKTGTNINETVEASQDEVNQRAGRAGRVAPGRCIRLFSETQYVNRREHAQPQIELANLSNEILLLYAYGEDPETFPFMHPPTPEKLAHAITELKKYGALDEHGAITQIGKEMAEFSFDTPVARMVVEGKHQGLFMESFVLAALFREDSVSQILHRLPREGIEREEKDRRRKEIYNGSSDALMLLAIFAEASERGLFGARREDTQTQSPDEWEKQEGFWDWCRACGINGQSLQHTKHTIFRMCEDYNKRQKQGNRLFINKETIGATLRELLQHPEKIGAVITGTYRHDMLYMSDSYGHLPDYSYVDGRRSSSGYGVTVNMSPGSRCFFSRPKIAVNIGRVHTGQGKGRRGAEITRNYANLNHPSTLDELLIATPDLLQETVSDVVYDTESGAVQRTRSYTLKGRSINLGSKTETLAGTEAIPAVARALAQNRILDTSFATHNKTVIETLQTYHKKTGGVVVVPDMTEWYEQQLHAQGIDPLATASEHPEALTLHVEDFLTNAQKEAYEMQYPDTVTLHGQTCTVVYTYNPKSTYSQEEYVARVQVPSEEVLFSMPVDIHATIGTEQQSPRITYLMQYNTYVRFEEENISALQEKVDVYRINQAWQVWTREDNTQRELAYTDIRTKIPSPAQYGFQKIPYTRTRNQEPVYAYPAVNATDAPQSAEGNEWKFFITYHKNEDEARTAQEHAEETRKKFLEEEKRRIAVDRDLPALKEKIDSLREEVEKYISYYAEYDVSYDDISHLQRAWNTAQYGVEGKEVRNGYIYNTLIYPEKIRDALTETEEHLTNIREYARTAHERKARLEDFVTEHSDFVNFAREHRYTQGGWARYGFNSRETFNTCMDAWDTILRATREEVPTGQMLQDAETATTIVRDTLASIDTEAWSTPVAQDYLTRKESKHRGIYARIRVSNGAVEVLDSNSNAFISATKFSIGQSGRSARVTRLSNGQLGMQAFSGNGGPMSGVVPLEDGDYDIFRDMDSVFKVERDDAEPHTVRKVLEEIDLRSDYTDEDLFAGYSTSAKDHYTDTVYTEVAEAGGVNLEAAFREAQEKRKPKKSEKPEVRSAQIIQDQRRHAHQEQKQEYSERWRMMQENILESLETTLSILATWIKAYSVNDTLLPREKTKRERAIEKLQRRIPEERSKIKDARQSVVESRARDDVSDASRRIDTIRQSVEALAKDADRSLRDGDGGWSADILHIYAGVRQAIEESVEAQEYIESDMVTPEQLENAMRPLLTNALQADQTIANSDTFDYTPHIEDALNQLTA
jgi:HrpA-like RNA helicase